MVLMLKWQRMIGELVVQQLRKHRLVGLKLLVNLQNQLEKLLVSPQNWLGRLLVKFEKIPQSLLLGFLNPNPNQNPNQNQ